MTDFITLDPPASPAPGKGEPVLEVRDLSVDFGVDKKWVPAAIGLNYEVRAGEVLAIVGESGSGKSASSMALLGLLPSNSRVTGSVKLAGRELLGSNEANIRAVRGKDVAVIFQEPMTALNPVYTVGSQIVETVRLHNEVSPGGSPAPRPAHAGTCRTARSGEGLPVLPAPAFRRPAPARHDRAVALLRPEAADCR